MEQVREAEHRTGTRIPSRVPMAMIGPSAQLWDKIEHAPATVAAPMVFAAPRGFLPPLRRDAGNGGAPAGGGE